MIVLGIESSCDELSMSLVRDGRHILALVTSSQIEQHRPYSGVVPELAGRLHAQQLLEVYRQTLDRAQTGGYDGIAVTVKPGLAGSLLMGLSFAKGLALSKKLPLVGVDHLLAHLYAPHLEHPLDYPFIGLLVSGGHTLLVAMEEPFGMRILGTTVDDAVGEAFDKVAKHLGLGYPGGPIIDRLAREGNDRAFHFPVGKLEKGRHPCDMSFSGLKTAVLHQRDQFQDPRAAAPTLADIAASFQRRVIGILMDRLERAVELTGIKRIVVGGGVAANSYLRQAASERNEWEWRFPPQSLCADNGAMIAALGWEYLRRGEDHGPGLQVSGKAVRFSGDLYP